LSNKKPQKPKLFSDQKVTRDKNGRLRIGGRFASIAKVNQLQGIRKRRGLDKTPVIKSTPKPKRTSKGKTKASRAALKAAATRRLKAEGVSERNEYTTDRAGYRNVEYSIPAIDADLIRGILERESIGEKRLLIYSKIRGVTSDQNEIMIGTPMKIVDVNDLDSVANVVADEMGAVAAQYLIEDILDILIFVSFGR